MSWYATSAQKHRVLSIRNFMVMIGKDDEGTLSASIKALPVGECGWIALSEARALFSPMDDQYAFGEMDNAGKTNLAKFAAESEHRSSFDIMPAEGRVYFTRKAT
jgi:hypothetical protein